MPKRSDRYFMDLVLGLSMTSSSVRWVLVEESLGDGATLDRGSRPLDDIDGLLDALVDRAAPDRLHAVGLTWGAAAETAASAVWQALTDRGVENVIAISDVEAAEALALGIADVAECDRVVVCVAEPGAPVVAAVTPDGVTADRVDPAYSDIGAVAPEAVFVLGSGDVTGVVAALEGRVDAPLVSADEAALALARGAALASASAVAILDAHEEPRRRMLSPTAALASVLAAAVVTLVVSASAAVGMSLTPETHTPQMAGSVEQPVREAAPPRVLPPKPSAPPPAPAAPVANELQAPPEAVEVAAPPAPPEAPPPVYDQPLAPAPEYVPPAPDYVPPPDYLPPAPGAPVLVPPGGPLPAAVPPPVTVETQQPRLRDRIIERIPIINRFHEPQYTP